MKKSPKKISLFLLVLLVVSAIDSIRNLPSSAIFGSSLIFFFLFAAIFFLIPTSLVAAELSSLLPDKGGVYHWMTYAFGDKVGMLSIWLQWINTMVWYPTILSFIAGTAAYIINPVLVENKFYLISIILSIFWGLTIINLFGIQISAKVNSFCGLIGTMFPMVLLIVLGAIWVIKGNVSSIDITFKNILPSFKSNDSWISLTAIMASFLGIELAGVHANDIKNPLKNFPKAMGYSSFFLLFTMIFGSLAIAIVLPSKEINLVSGVMQVFTNFFSSFNMSWPIPVMTVLILIGSIGSIINWLISPAKGLLHAAEYGFLPSFFIRKNKFGIAHNVLLAQGVVVSLFCLIFFLVPGVNAFYWFLTGLSTTLYMFMYILMFLSAIVVYYKVKKRSVGFRIPGKSVGIWVTVIIGLLGCLLTIFVGFIPPEHINIHYLHYASYMVVGIISMILPVVLFYIYRGKNKKPKHTTKIKEPRNDTKGRPFNV